MTDIPAVHLWADEGCLQLVLTPIDGDRLSVAIVNVANDQQLAACTIANYRVGLIAQLAARIDESHKTKCQQAMDRPL